MVESINILLTVFMAITLFSNYAEKEPGRWTLITRDITAAVGPWGISYDANLIPHETGLGN